MSLAIDSFSDLTLSVQEVNGAYHWSTPPQAADIIALAHLLLRKQVSRGQSLNNIQPAVDFFKLQLGTLLHEELWAVFLDTKLRVICTEKMFRGTVNEARVYPREIVRQALLVGASSVILAHNHPSGDIEPSEADCNMTQVVDAVLALVNIELTDHFIVSPTAYKSFREAGLLNFRS